MEINKKINENSYDVPALWYDIRGFLILTFAYRNSLLRQVRFFAENLKGHHLECAIGTATLTMLTMIYKKIFYSKTNYKMVGVDYSEALLKGAKWKMKNSELLKEDLRSMSFSDETFDSVNFANGYHTLEGIEKAMGEVTRVLKKGGTLYLNVLLVPKKKLLDGISKRVNTYGASIGILKRPYTVEECLDIPNQFNLNLISYHIQQNCMYMKLEKK